MLSASPITPRPRPPHRQPRRGSLSAALLTGEDSPPPYASPRLSNNECAVAISDDNGPSSDCLINQKSQEELSKMLLNAQAIIARRQHELTVAASVGKELLERNMELKTKYEGLLSRIPISSASSPPEERRRPKRAGSWITDEEDSGESPISSRSSTSLDVMTPKGKTHRHSRHLSASPSAVAFLYSQNETLLTQLAAIEQETAQAEQEGRQHLRALEREISALHAELEASQKRTAELEEQMRVEKAKEQEKSARNARLKALRNRLRDKNGEETSPTSFAPPGGSLLFQRRSSPSLRVIRNAPPMISVAAEEFIKLPRVPHIQYDASLISPRSPSEARVTVQLLAKISELEAANKELLSRHLDTRSKLDRASKDAAALNSAYDTIERDEIAEDQLLRESSGSSIGHRRHQSYDVSVPQKRRKGRPRSISIVNGPSLKTPSLRPRVRSALTPSTFLSPNGSLPQSRDVSPTRTSGLSKRYSTSLAEELQSAWLKVVGDPNFLESEEESLSFPRTESQIDAALFTLRSQQSIGAQTKFGLPTHDLLSEPSTFGHRASRSPSFPGAFEIPSSEHESQPAVGNYPNEDLDVTPLSPHNHGSLRKTTSLMDLKVTPRSTIRSRRTVRKTSLRIEGLDLAGHIEDEDEAQKANVEVSSHDQDKFPWTSLLLEIWIFLQFCAVLAIFVFSMARKGPRGVIKRTAHDHT